MTKKNLQQKMKRMNVTLDKSTIEKLGKIAFGNLSMAIRLVVKEYKIKK